MKRFSRPVAVLSATAIVSSGLLLAAAPASAAVLGDGGSIAVNPLTGVNNTLFVGTLSAACPAGTTDSYFTISGPDITEENGFLGQGTADGTGANNFSGASIANLRSTAAGSFSANGVYKIRFNCFGASSVTDYYETTMNYTFGVSNTEGAYSIVVPARATATALSVSPVSPVEQGTAVTLTADVTPISGADNATGSVEFYDGAALLGTDTSLTAAGVGDYTTSGLSVGAHSLTAKYVPASGTFSTSSSPATSYTVNAVAARPTTSVVSATPLTGAAYTTSVTVTCDVTPTTGTAVGSVVFRYGTSTLGSATTGTPNAGATRYSITTSALPGTANYSCAFTGTAPYGDSSSSNVVSGNYANQGAEPDEQTVTVVIPTGVLTITTPYTPAAPLSLGTAVLDATDSTYSSSATFGTPGSGPGQGYITVTDTRAGNLGWQASLIAGAFSNGTSSFGGNHAGLTNLSVIPVVGNALQASNVSVSNHPAFTDGLGTLKQFASYPSGATFPTGTANLSGLFSIDQVPTSITPGTYTSVVTFTAL